MATLTQVHKTSSPDALHVIFVHGLGGEARHTWMNNPKDHMTLWPSWVGEDTGCHVWVAGYGAALSGWSDAAMHLADLGEALFSALQVEKDLKGRSIVLVGHSLGGLVIKSGMTQAQALGDAQRLTLLERIAGVVFVGTPHQGASLATIANSLRLALRTNPQVTNMVNDDAWLKLLNGQFRALHTRYSFGVRVFFESKGVLIGRKILGISFGKRLLIVDRNSSDPGLTGVIATPIEGDHLEIAKPRSRNELIHKALVEFLQGLADGPAGHPPTGGLPQVPESNSIDLQTALRNASAALLSWPSTLADGTWLQRPELEVLSESLSIESSSTHFVLGDPGCGKSSLLVRLAREWHATDRYVLAIKADRLPPNVLDREALANYLNLGTDTGAAVRQLARNSPVLVLIDQVDALADLVVQQSARLRVLLDLVQELSNVEGVHTVISCRTFEQKHDPALRNLEATVIRLELPEWTTVQPLLMKKGLQAELWNNDIQQVLRSPHALDIFLTLLGGARELDVLRGFQGLLEKQWETHVLSDATGRRRATLRHLAKLMADREVLGLPLAQVEDHYPEIQVLAAAGLLRVDQGPGRVEFRHQTLYEFVRARSFLEESGSLTETVQLKQGSLRIRPQLWHALGYFRSASPDEYDIEICKLWEADLRPHLKILLIEFLGLQTAPTFAERRLMEQSITDKWFQPRFITAAVGSPGWFSILVTTHLPKLMALPTEQAQTVLPMLMQALHFNADAVVNLVSRNWLPNVDRDVLSWQVLGSGESVPQVGKWLDSLILITRRSSVSEWAIGHISAVVSADFPEEAPKLVAAWIERQIDATLRKLDSTLTSDDTTATRNTSEFSKILETRNFYDMEAVAEAAPKAFILAIWPNLIRCLQLSSSQTTGAVIGYYRNNGLTLQDFDNNDTRHDRSLLESVRLGIQGWAEVDPEDFLNFMTENAHSDLLLVHRLLATGIIHAATHSPQRAVDYLLADNRRLVLGPYSNVHKESLALISVVCPLLDDISYSRLEMALINWRYYIDEAKQDDASVRHQRLQWARQHRLRLLRALPVSRRSPAMQKLMEEEERAFPGLSDKDVHFSGAQMIGSSVSAMQMERAADADILNIFDELTDDAAWDHPRHPMKGGAIQAGRELAELAKIDLAKVLRIIRALDPERNEIPVSCVLRELVPAGLTAQALYSLIQELEDKGFTGTSFRHDASYAIINASNKEATVPDELIDRMELWLVSSNAEDSNTNEPDAKNDSSSVLWGQWSMGALPDGNYPTLSALTSACLTAEPPRLDRWLTILGRHTVRVESLQVWEALLQRDLVSIRLADQSRAESVFDSLVANMPSIVETRGWVHFVAQSYHWASAAAAKRWLSSIIERAGEGLQGAGELACLRHALFPAEDWSRNLIGVLSNDDSPATALGIAHAVANLWHEPMTRPVVHPILLQLLRSHDKRILTGLSTIFLNDGFVADIETVELLDALAAFPEVLKNDRAEHFPEKLVKVLPFDPERVSQLAHALLDVAGNQMGNISTSWYLNTEWLIDIALQLQDMGPSERVAGSILFERMLEFNMPQAREMTLDLDKRTPVGNRARAPIRRRSRPRTRQAKNST